MAFLTFNTFRQAAWAPDQYSTGIVGSTQLSSNSYTNFGFGGGTTTVLTTQTRSTTGTPTSNTYYINTIYVQPFVTQVSEWSQAFALSVQNSPLVTNSINGTSASTSSTTNFWQVPAGFGANSNFSFLSIVTAVSGTTQSYKSTVTMKGPLGTTALASTLFLSSGSTFTRGFAGSTTQTGSSSTVGSSSSTTSTSGTTAGFATSVSTLTTTVASTMLDCITTTSTSATGSFSRWTMSAGAPTITTASASTTATTFTSAAFTYNSTTTSSTNLPSWWGWSMEIGTVLLATANTDTDDLPAWLATSISAGVFGLWNFSFGTQTTLWPTQPTATAFQATLSNTTALPSVSSIPIISTGAFTLVGTSSYTSAIAGTAVSQFTDSSDPAVSTAAVPLVTQARTVTSYSRFTSAVTATVIHDFNTSTSSTTSNSGPAPVSRFFGPSMTLGNSPQFHGSLTTTFTMTTLVAGHTTASIASGLAGSTLLQSTAIITGPNLSVTTTTSSATWFYNSSCPTATGATTMSTSSSSTTTVNSTWPATSNYGTTIGGTSGAFTQNQFAQPYVITSPASFMTSPGASIFAPAAAQSWQPTPSMQAFSPWGTQSSTFSAFLAPTGQSLTLPFRPFASGTLVSVDSLSRAVTSTATGLWAILPWPVTTTYSTTATTTETSSTSTVTTTATVTYTTVDHLSFQTTWSNAGASSSGTLLINWPANANETAGTIYSTGSTTGPSGTATTTATTATSLTGFSWPTATVTATFCETYGFQRTIFLTTTVSVLSTLASLTGANSTISFYSTSVANPVVSITKATTSSGATFQFFPGVGGSGKYAGGPATIYACAAAVSLWGTGSTTWSSADPNFFQVVIGGSFTTSSSTTSNLGAGVFNAYTIPGAASMATSPAFWVSTKSDRFAPAATAQSQWWAPPAPVLVPEQSVIPGKASLGKT